jgi:hypothetical protein
LESLPFDYRLVTCWSANINRASGSPTLPSVGAPIWRSWLILAPLTPSWIPASTSLAPTPSTPTSPLAFLTPRQIPMDLDPCLQVKYSCWKILITDQQ